MNRRDFFKRLALATAGATVAYSFPSIIVPKNIIRPDEITGDILWNTNKSASPITYRMLEEAYRKIAQGNAEPNLIVIPNWATYKYVSRLSY